MAVIREKQAGYTQTEAGDFPSLYDASDNVILGSFSWFYEQSRKRVILSRFAYRWPGGVVCTPSDLARGYLAVFHPRRLRATGEQARAYHIHRSQPLYAQPHRAEWGVYIDLRSAYWQILQVVGWDVDYNPGKWLSVRSNMDDWPYPDLKLARNCLVTAGLVTPRNIWSGRLKRFISRVQGNKHVNYGLWSVVMDVLHGIARDARAAGAFYVHTDGYICRKEREAAVLEAVSGWGLTALVKREGRTAVRGVGCYSVGENSTKTEMDRERAFDGIVDSQYHNQLKAQFRKFAERTKFRWTTSAQAEESEKPFKNILAMGEWNANASIPYSLTG